jgi:hypothetical protein
MDEEVLVVVIVAVVIVVVEGAPKRISHKQEIKSVEAP